MKEIVDWYNAIRAAKFEWRRIAHPDKDEKEVNIYIYIVIENVVAENVALFI